MEKMTRIATPEELSGKKWYVVDATGQTVGRLSVAVATLLRGKNKVFYTSHQDAGDYVIVVNASKVAFTGKKWSQKMYYRHSGYPGGFKSATAKEVRERKPEHLIVHAVKGMLPKNKLANQFMSRLKVYAAEAHPHQAQNPEVYAIAGGR
ncbi:MAG: 50S ribosomal protein L13 [Nitrospirae bacterium]|jgi:large subunit ribosomal protein L13|uniref:Large ribosomal subunit protein uL13 n=1 Tax=Leptospirillum ferrodiazotrophum TaxID=412449 RepID=C6HZ57_9BACT|nr:MAG: ribosomal protein L13 [Leptospirillum ferrodiazotrophum]MCL5953231.1 50S ribosomal protein L13 [Nitrospirota bacterium]